MEHSKYIRLMKKSGFSEKEIQWIEKRADRLGIGIDTLLVELSGKFIKLLKCHIVTAIIIITFIIFDHENMSMLLFISYTLTYLIGVLAIRTQGPMIKSFKSYRLLKIINS